MKNKTALLFTIGVGLALVTGWLLTLAGVGTPVAHAASFTVCPAGPPTCDYSIIQDAVDAAGDGDVIKIAVGAYTEINHYGGLAQIVYLNKSKLIGTINNPVFCQPGQVCCYK